MPSIEPQQPHELLVEGRLYDCTGFKHPGGSIIKYNLGSGDATEGFNEFHVRSEKAVKMLKLLPNRPAPPLATKDKAKLEQERRQAKMTADFSKLRKQLLAEGWYDPSPSHALYRCAELICMHLLGIYMLLNTALWIPALAILGIASGRCGWWMHEAGHFSFTGNIKLDWRLQEFIYGYGCGMSGAWWRIQHNKHHATPQKLKHDVDLDTLPLVAWHASIAKTAKKGSLMAKWLSFQKYTFAPVSCMFIALFWQFFLHPRHMIRRRQGFELVSCALRMATVYYLCVAMGLTLGQSILGYVLYDLFGGVYIFTNFALSHTHLGVVPENEHVHWLEYASVYTINITPSLLCNWWMGYLNFQIEHHLFPCMPQFRFVQLSPRIKALFEANGLKYDVRNYFSAMGDTWCNLDSVAQSLDA